MEKRKREAWQQASLEFTIAMAAGVKRRGGGGLKIEDFLPEFAKDTEKKTTPEESESRLMAALKKAAANTTEKDG